MSRVEAVQSHVTGLEKPRKLLPTPVCVFDSSRQLPQQIIGVGFSAAC
jgi:hypothetical protein